MQPSGLWAGVRVLAPMRVLSERMVAVLAAGMLASMVLLSAQSTPPPLSIAQLWGMGEDASVSVRGLMVSLRAYESGSETLVIADEPGTVTVKVVCSPGPGSAPSRFADVGDLLSVSGECVFEAGVPTVFCRYCDVSVLMPSEEVLTVRILGEAWHLYEGDVVVLAGVCVPDGDGAPRLHDVESGCSIAMRLAEGVPMAEGPVLVECVPVLDPWTMALLLEVSAMAPPG